MSFFAGIALGMGLMCLAETIDSVIKRIRNKP